MNKCIIGSCLDVLPTLEAGSVDVVIADPPYGETSLPWDKWPPGWLDLLLPLMKPGATLWVFGTVRMFMKHASQFSHWNLAQDVVWEKHNGAGAGADRFKRVHEMIAQFYPVGVKWGDVYKNILHSDDATARTVRRKARPQHWGDIGESFYESADGGPRLLRSVWCCRSMHGIAIHPTEKPQGIIAPLIEFSCPPGGLVLAPFSGSGAVEKTALKLGRNAIGIELNPEYAKLQDERTAQQSMVLA